MSFTTFLLVAISLNQATADVAFKKVLKDYDELGRSQTQDKDQLIEEFHREALAFWKQYPTDPRRYQFLREFSHAQLADRAAQQKWQTQYASLRAEFWRDPVVRDEQRRELNRDELLEELFNARKSYAKGFQQVDMEEMQKELLAFVNRFLDFGGYGHPIEIIFDTPEVFGLNTPNKMIEFIAPFKRTSNKGIVDYVKGQERRARLAFTPLELRFNALDGRRIDLQNLRGKVVFIDMWNTGCTTCVERMPKLLELYHKYKSDGLEIVGICPDIDARRAVAEKIIKNVGSTWPTYYIGGQDRRTGKAAEFMKRFSLVSFPQTMLLGRDGKLIANNPDHETLEEALRKALGLSHR